MYFKIVVLWSVFLALTVEGQELQVNMPTAPSDDRSDKLDELLNNRKVSTGSSLIVYLLEELKTTQAQLHHLKDTVQADIQNLTSGVQRCESQQQALAVSTLMTQTQLENLDAGSTFIRWGRKTCPANTTLAYTGIAGGKQYNEKGSGTNWLCLTNNPQFDGITSTNTQYYGQLYGSEYEFIGNHHNHDVPCSVCLAPYSTTIMIPATLTCPPGWTKQYNGHLVSQHFDFYATEYDCLDSDPENYDSGLRDENQNVLYYVLTRCGSLPCPPYVNNMVVTCVVCSK